MSDWWLGPFQKIDGKHFAVDVREACGAPNGIQCWITELLEITQLSESRWPTRFNPLDEENELAVNAKGSLPGVTVVGYVGWATRLSLLRYNYLSSFFKINKPKPSAPDDPDLLRLWNAWQRADLTARKLRERYVAAARRTQSGRPPPLKRGPRGNVVLREVTRSLLRLYNDLFGVPATQTVHGPASRFVNAFFRDFAGEWRWVDATDMAEFEDSGEPMPAFEIAIKIAKSDTIQRVIRTALDYEKKNELTFRMERPEQAISGFYYYVPGSYYRRLGKRAQFGTDGGQFPQIRGL